MTLTWKRDYACKMRNDHYTNILCLKHLWGYVIPGLGNLAEETSCVFIDISIMVHFFPCILKVDSSNSLTTYRFTLLFDDKHRQRCFRCTIDCNQLDTCRLLWTCVGLSCPCDGSWRLWYKLKPSGTKMRCCYKFSIAWSNNWGSVAPTTTAIIMTTFAITATEIHFAN
jgi:hypothetical protein